MVGIAGAATFFLQALLQPPVQVGVRIPTESLSVGQPFEVAVVVRAPLFAEVEFPEAPNPGAVELVDPVRRSQRSGWDWRETTATYRAAAWAVGELDITFPPARVRALGATRDLGIPRARLLVHSVLPEDTSLHRPRPARDVLGGAALPWWIGALVFMALIGAGVVAVWWFRRRRTPGQGVSLASSAEPERIFGRIESLSLDQAGEPGWHVVLMADALRQLLAIECPDLKTSLTSSELLRALPVELAHWRDDLAALLREADAVKFANAEVAPQRARRLGEVAQRLARALKQPGPGSARDAA
jgi:hypothetical protein